MLFFRMGESVSMGNFKEIQKGKPKRVETASKIDPKMKREAWKYLVVYFNLSISVHIFLCLYSFYSIQPIQLNLSMTAPVDWSRFIQLNQFSRCEAPRSPPSVWFAPGLMFDEQLQQTCRANTVDPRKEVRSWPLWAYPKSRFGPKWTILKTETMTH